MGFRFSLFRCELENKRLIVRFSFLCVTTNLTLDFKHILARGKNKEATIFFLLKSSSNQDYSTIY